MGAVEKNFAVTEQRRVRFIMTVLGCMSSLLLIKYTQGLYKRKS